MSEAQLRKFVGYFMESLDPEVYYPDLIKRSPSNFDAFLKINEKHEVVYARANINNKLIES